MEKVFQRRTMMQPADLKRPALLPEDGATFHGRIDRVESAGFRAECWATLDMTWGLRNEEPAYRICASEHEAEEWIKGQGALRGFATWWLERNDTLAG
jgi:hypothetical protein